MTLFQAFILGLIQAFTEFFPVSSSAHLKLTKILLGIEPKGDLILFDLSCHLGTLIAIIYFFRLEIMEICKDRGKKFCLIFGCRAILINFY